MERYFRVQKGGIFLLIEEANQLFGRFSLTVVHIDRGTLALLQLVRFHIAKSEEVWASLSCYLMQKF